MIGTIRKHQNWLWIVIICAVVISFVWFFSPNARMHSDETPQGDFGSINGKPITAKQFSQARREAELGMFLNYHEWPNQDERLRQMLDQSAYQRILMDTKLKELNVEVSYEAKARLIKQLFGIEPSQQLPIQEFNRFLETQLAPKGISEADFERFIAHQVGQQHLISLFGMSGKLITTNEAASFYRRENEPIQAQAAIFSISNYLAQVNVTPQAIGEFYTNNLSAYRLPNRVQVYYVKYPLTNYYAEVDKELAANTNLNQIIEETYAKQGEESFKDASGNKLSKADAEAQIKKEIRDYTARNKARQAANTFLTDLYNSYSDSNPFKLEDFEKFAKTKGLAVKSTEPFDPQTGPKDIKSPDFVQRAFRLFDDPTDASKRTLFSASPILAEDAVYAISLKQAFPSEVQPLETVRAAVTDAYKRSRATELAMASATAFASAATNGLAAGKSFAAIGTAEKVTTKNLTPFSLATRSIPEIDAADFERIQSVAPRMPNGTSSPMIPGQDHCYVLYVEKRLPVDEAKMKAELPAYVARLRNDRQSAAFGEWFEKTAREMKLVIPRSGM